MICTQAAFKNLCSLYTSLTAILENIAICKMPFHQTKT